MERFILHCDGRKTPIPEPVDYEDAADLIGATLLNVVDLRDGRMLMVDESGHPKGLPLNPFGTNLYRSVCRPGTTSTVVGDVLVVPAVEFPDFC